MGMLDAVHDVQRRFETFNRRMAPGSLGGRTEVASPVSPQGRGVLVPTTRVAAGGGDLGGGVACVWFQNRYKTYVLNAHKWDIATSVGDTSWFQFNETDDPGLYDRSHVRIMAPGFVMASAWSSGLGQTSAQMDVYGLSTVARAEGTDVSLAAGWSWTADEVEDWPTIQVITAGTGDRSGHLALMFVPGTSALEYFGDPPNGDPP